MNMNKTLALITLILAISSTFQQGVNSNRQFIDTTGDYQSAPPIPDPPNLEQSNPIPSESSYPEPSSSYPNPSPSPYPVPSSLPYPVPGPSPYPIPSPSSNYPQPTPVPSPTPVPYPSPSSSTPYPSPSSSTPYPPHPTSGPHPHPRPQNNSDHHGPHKCGHKGGQEHHKGGDKSRNHENHGHHGKDRQNRDEMINQAVALKYGVVYEKLDFDYKTQLNSLANVSFENDKIYQEHVAYVTKNYRQERSRIELEEQMYRIQIALEMNDDDLNEERKFDADYTLENDYDNESHHGNKNKHHKKRKGHCIVGSIIGFLAFAGILTCCVRKCRKMKAACRARRAQQQQQQLQQQQPQNVNSQPAYHYAYPINNQNQNQNVPQIQMPRFVPPQYGNLQQQIAPRNTTSNSTQSIIINQAAVPQTIPVNLVMNNGVLHMVPLQQQQQPQQHSHNIQQQYQPHNQQSSHVVQGNLNQIQNQNVRGRKYPEIELEDRTNNNSNANHNPVIGTPVQVPVYPRQFQN